MCGVQRRGTSKTPEIEMTPRMCLKNVSLETPASVEEFFSDFDFRLVYLLYIFGLMLQGQLNDRQPSAHSERYYLDLHHTLENFQWPTLMILNFKLIIS